MKNNLNTTLLKNLIKSNFFFLESHFLKINQNRSLNKKFNIKTFDKQIHVNILDPLEVIKSLKQMIRVLQYLKKDKKSFLNLEFENSFYSELLKSLSKKKPFFNKNVIYDKKVLLQPTKNSKASLVIGSMTQNLLNKGFFLITEINAQKNNSNLGFYKIYNSINDWKKFIFLILLIKNIYTDL